MLSAPPAYIRDFRHQQLLQGLALLLSAFGLRSLAVVGTHWRLPLEPILSTTLMVAPAVVHVAAASLMTLSIVRRHRWTPLLTCGFWTVGSVLLECFEHDAALAWAMSHAPLWLLAAGHDVVSLRQVGSTRGFHLTEVIAALAGGVASFFYIRNRWPQRT
jgi:hypothetical protein